MMLAQTQREDEPAKREHYREPGANKGTHQYTVQYDRADDSNFEHQRDGDGDQNQGSKMRQP